MRRAYALGCFWTGARSSLSARDDLTYGLFAYVAIPCAVEISGCAALWRSCLFGCGGTGHGLALTSR